MKTFNEKSQNGKSVCGQCSGTGTFEWGGSVNGVPRKQGVCYACQGKGVQSSKDVKRNNYYWNFCARIN